MRNRYLDLLRAAAIVRVIVYHLFGWPWLSIVLPAMGIMFALAGSLTAGSLDKRPAEQVISSRLRRLLPPLWVLGLIAVPVMLVAGWAQERHGEHPFSPARLLFWIVPLGDPPGSDRGIDVWEPLWYLRAYVWFVLLSPLMYAFYRRTGWFAVAAPILMIGVLDLTGITLPGTADAAMWDFVTYGACWIAGFAHHDGRLRATRPWLLVPVSAVLCAAALYWLRGHQGEDPWDLNDVSESQALWSIAFVLLALRWQPPTDWLARIRPLDQAVNLLNARAVTVYLWHNIAIAAVWPVLTLVALDDLSDRLGDPVDLVTAGLLTLLAVLAFGWAEDLAAQRRPRLWPTGAPVRLPPDPRAALRRNPGRAVAEAAMARMPAGWPPAPREAAEAGPDEPTPPHGIAAEPAGVGVGVDRVSRHAGTGERTMRHDRGFPVAGRRVEPLIMDDPSTGTGAARLDDRADGRPADGRPADRHADGLPADGHADGLPADRHGAGRTAGRDQQGNDLPADGHGDDRTAGRDQLGDDRIAERDQRGNGRRVDGPHGTGGDEVGGGVGGDGGVGAERGGARGPVE